MEKVSFTKLSPLVQMIFFRDRILKRSNQLLIQKGVTRLLKAWKNSCYISGCKMQLLQESPDSQAGKRKLLRKKKVSIITLLLYGSNDLFQGKQLNPSLGRLRKKMKPGELSPESLPLFKTRFNWNCLEIWVSRNSIYWKSITCNFFKVNAVNC